MALSIASLVCLVLVGLGGTNKNNNTYNNYYFFRANTSDITISPSDLPISIPDTPLTDGILNETTSAVATALGIYDFYHVSLWNYCAGNYTTESGNASSVTEKVTYCSERQNAFWFNPVDVWHLNNTNIDHFFSKELRSGLNTYRTVSRWMFIAYVVALISTIVEILVGFTALFSRLGSLATTVVSTVSSIFILGFALTSTILYSTLTGTFNHALTKYNVRGHMGHNMYVAAWLGTAFSLGAGLFWLLSSCCCSGRSDRMKGYDKKSGKASGAGWGRRKGSKGVGMPFVGKTPYQYNRVESPERGGLSYGEPAGGYPNLSHSGQQPHYSSGPVASGGQRQSNYEPFRHHGA